jgi:hypothetical protein
LDHTLGQEKISAADLPPLGAGDPSRGYEDEGGEEDLDITIAKSATSFRLGGRHFGSALTDCPTLDEEVGQLGRGQYLWQWQRTAGGFRNYNPVPNDHIEEAYRRGHSKVRVKSGPHGTTPMEIFFVDMIQVDPQSRNIRSVRRLGAKIWYIEWGRHVQAIVRSVFLGVPRWESFERYKERQGIVLSGGSGTPTSPRGPGEEGDIGLVDSTLSRSSVAHLQKADNVCTRITESASFLTTSMLFTSLNIVWIGISVELGEFNQHLWHQRDLSIIIEHFFMVYFFAEIMIQLVSLKYRALCFCNPWFRLDAACTATILLEVLVVPYTGITAASALVKQMLRLTRLLWLFKIFREFKDAVTIQRGMVIGMRSAAFIWVLIAVLLYACGVLLAATSNHNDFLREEYFGSMGQTVTALITYGIALDGVSEFFHDLRMNGGLFQGLVFTMFVVLTYFGLLNMLVGTFCNVAIETATQEKDVGEIRYLERHLPGIVECYMGSGSDRINSDRFQLLMKDADVLQTLQDCGTDTDGLLTLSEVLFPHEDSEISFPEFFSVIVRLRKGKPASISEIIGLQEFTKQKLDGLEDLIRHGLKMKRSRSTKMSVIDADRVRRNMTRLEEDIRPEQRSEGSPRVRRRSRQDAEKIRQNWIRSVSSDKFALF